MSLPAYLKDHVPHYRELSPKEREKVQNWCAICAAIDAAPQANQEIQEQAARFEGVRGFSASRINTVYYEKWLKSGRDWRAFLRKKKGPQQRCVFLLLDVFKRYVHNNTRSQQQAWNQMMSELFAGQVLEPGGVTWRDVYRLERPKALVPAECPYDLQHPPKGCHLKSFQREADFTTYEIAATRIGTNAARHAAFQVLTTRVGLEVGEVIQFDDMHHDSKVNYPGNQQSFTALEFAAVDVFSGSRFAFYLRPTLQSVEEGGKKRRKMLKEVEFRRLVCIVLCHPNFGYRAKGCKLIGEHGTACFRPELRELLTLESGGAITFGDSEVLSKQVHSGLWPGSVGGNFRAKGLLEGQHALAHSMAACVPGQTGSNSRLNRPEQLKGMDKYNEEMIAVYEELKKVDPERAELLYLPQPSFYEYAAFIQDLYTQMNQRKLHKLEGYIEAGLTVNEYRYALDSSDWKDQRKLLEMPEHIAAGIRYEVDKEPRLARSRVKSPAEVYHQGREGLVQLSEWLIPDILGDADRVEATVKADGKLAFEKQDLGPGKFTFHNVLKSQSGMLSELPEGGTYYLYANPIDGIETAYVRDMKTGKVLGKVPRYRGVCQNDEHGMKSLWGARNHDRKQRSLRIEAVHGPDAEDRKALMEHNEEVLAGNIETPTETCERLEEEERGFDPSKFEAAYGLPVDEEQEREWTDDEINARFN